MAALEIEGKIKTKLAQQGGSSARGAWVKQDFVIEYPDGNYTSEACLTAWGQDKVDDLARFGVGDAVKVSFNIKAREYQGRWYNDLRVWRIAAPQAAQPQRPQAEAFPPQGSVPPPPSFGDMPAEPDTDDLPF